MSNLPSRFYRHSNTVIDLDKVCAIRKDDYTVEVTVQGTESFNLRPTVRRYYDLPSEERKDLNKELYEDILERWINHLTEGGYSHEL